MVLSAGCFCSFPFEELWDWGQEEDAGGDSSAVGGVQGSAAGEDGGEV